MGFSTSGSATSGRAAWTSKGVAMSEMSGRQAPILIIRPITVSGLGY